MLFFLILGSLFLILELLPGFWIQLPYKPVLVYRPGNLILFISNKRHKLVLCGFNVQAVYKIVDRNITFKLEIF